MCKQLIKMNAFVDVYICLSLWFFFYIFFGNMFVFSILICDLLYHDLVSSVFMLPLNILYKYQRRYMKPSPINREVLKFIVRFRNGMVNDYTYDSLRLFGQFRNRHYI